MKIPSTSLIMQYIKDKGIHPAPETLTKSELKNLSADPVLRQEFFAYIQNEKFNIFQELEMSSAYVETHRDVTCEPEPVRLHSHSFYEIIYCETGNIQYLIADKRYHIHEGDLILVPPGISHRPLFYDEMSEPYSRIVLWVSTEFFRQILSVYPAEVLDELLLKSHFLLHTKEILDSSIEDYLKKGLKETEGSRLLSDLALYGNTISLLVHISRYMLSAEIKFKTVKRELIDEIIGFVEHHYAEKISMEAMAKSFHISTSTLGKVFTQKLGISFYHFVTQRRLINSKIKIEEGFSMEEVALDCGFGDYTVFYRAFKKEYGISPREYKKKILMKLE